ncbi:MAG: hypothetical protein JWO86_1459 [Myxococcaceae bacterium]|jgi:hypothetical protein|nr:hypothetical protein [Myxococcaceae bacterium]MEA2749417.1 hypothetical protein [Myxococcales bacterium]
MHARAWLVCGALAVTSAVGGALGACSNFSGDTSAPAGADGGNDAPASNPDAEPGVDGATVNEASTDAGVDSGHVARFILGCGMTACTIAGDVCCRDYGMTAPAGFSCARASDICPVSGDLRFTCDDNDDCTVLGFPGSVCCGTLSTSGNAYFLGKTECSLADNCVGPAEVRLCDRNVSGQCPTGKPCIDRTTYPEPNDGGNLWSILPSLAACAP